MSNEQKELSAITIDDLETLVANGVSESSIIEFKRELKLSSDEHKREFLADVTAMANTGGGRIFIGIEAAHGVASSLPGIDAAEVDGLVLQATSLLRDCVKPPISGMNTHQVPNKAGQKILIFHIPQSFSSPHMISFKGSQRFFARSSSGKHPMEYSEIRTAFLRGATAQERLDTLRSNRIQRVISGNDFRGISNGASAFLLEVVPIGTLFDSQNIDFRSIDSLRKELIPIDSLGGDYTFDFDGLVSYEWNHQTSTVLSFTRLNRAGFISAYTTSLVQIGEAPSFMSSHFEFRLAEAAEAYSKVLQKHNCLLPHAVMISLLNAKGLNLKVPFLPGKPRTFHPILENHLLIGTAMLLEPSKQPITVLRPQFDAIWNAFGYPNSINYDEEGNWSPKR